jgi:predicted RNA binding protein YcfA (HicA-like mRNA interferase family)
MSRRLPIVSAKDVVEALSKVGYGVVRQRGSHLRLKDPANPSHKPITVPVHKELKPGLLRKIIKDTDLSVDEFIELLGR